MKKILTALAAAILFLAAVPVHAQMTDDQVVAYVKTAHEAGKSQEQIVAELTARGVTRAQAERLQARYQNRVEGLSRRGAETEQTAAETERTLSETAESLNDATTINPVSQAVSGRIFGHNLFRSSTLTFEPNENVATPANYKLGPGDEIIIEVWGLNEANIRQTISAEGRINISMVGPVYLNGLTIKQAESKIKKALSVKYSSVDGENPASTISVSLGNVRTIRVNIMGEVRTPGTYRLSSFSTVFNALYRAGGVSDAGTLRAVEVIREGKKFATVDVYDYIFEGMSDTDINLMEGDVIIVPTYGKIVDINGSVKRPMRYEMTETETIADLIEYAGGFTGDAYRGDVNLVRVVNPEKEVYTVEEPSYSSFVLEDGDNVTVGANLSRYANSIEVAGYVFRPGMYELGGKIATVRQLIEAAGGVTEDAYLDRAILHREKENFDYENISVDLGALLRGEAEDILLKRNDVLTVAGIHDIEERSTLSINGYVTNPGTYPYAENTTLQDLIIKAGGFLDGASTARIEIARRVYEPEMMAEPDTLAYAFNISLSDGLAMSEEVENFILEPYDIVSVRRSPGYRPQRYITISGQVNFPGQYVVLHDSERVSEIVKRAGGVTRNAYLTGARVIRNYTDGEMRSILNRSIFNVSTSSLRDSTTAYVSPQYTVAIDLAAALDNPGSDADLVLQEGDRIVIPEYNNVVQIVGEVMFPNAISYEPGKNIRYYINAAGGFTQKAKRSKAYVVYMNGSASRTSLGNARIEPGCVIVVPTRPERKEASSQDLMATATMTTSLTSLVALILNLLK